MVLWNTMGYFEVPIYKLYFKILRVLPLSERFVLCYALQYFLVAKEEVCFNLVKY